MSSVLSENLGHTQIIKYPIVTDKTTQLLEKNQYTFIVDLSLIHI